MNETIPQNIDFLDIYNKSYRLAAAVFLVSNIMDQNDELKTKIKSLSLGLVSISVNLKDTEFGYAKKIITDLEKSSLELMSMLDIASISGLISKMNADILKEEFQSFISELGKLTQKFEGNKNLSVRSIFEQPQNFNTGNSFIMTNSRDNLLYENDQKRIAPSGYKNGNGHKRKDLRKNSVLEFIKGHDNVSIKDIVPNIAGCSEKTIQRELVSLINEGKIKKVGERRWSRYSIS